MIKQLESEIIYSDWKLVILLQKFVIPTNKTISRLIIDGNVHPILILPIIVDNKIILQKQYRYAANKWLWEVPGGLREDNETSLEGAKRELCEETGYMSDNFIKLGEQLWFDPALERISCDAYVALDCYKGNQVNRDFDEFVSSVQLFSSDEIFTMVDDGSIVDFKTLATILLGRKYIEKYSYKRSF